MQATARCAVVLAATLMLTGCAATQALEATAKRQAETTLPSGWRVDCVDDQHLAQRRCYAATFVDDVPFQVFYLNGAGPALMPGWHTYPGRHATVRVDNGPVLTVPTGTAKAIVAALGEGQTAYITYHEWPKGERRMALDLSGFNEAHHLLLEKMAAPLPAGFVSLAAG